MSIKLREQNFIYCNVRGYVCVKPCICPGFELDFWMQEIASGKATVGQTAIPVQKVNIFRSPYLTSKHRSSAFLKQKVQLQEI